MSDQGHIQLGYKFKLFGHRICINKKGINVSNGRKGIFLFHPWAKNFTFKQIKLIPWMFK